MIYRTSMGVALVLLQGPSPIQLQAYCTQLYMFGTQNIFHLTEPDDSALMYWRPEIPIEIAAFIRDVRSERRLQTHAPGLWDENSPAFFLAACADQRSVVLDFLDTLMNELRWRITVNCYDRTRSTYTWVKMASAFFKDQDKNQLIPDPHLREVQIAIEDTDAYVPTGNRVPLDEFCKPLAPLYVPAQGDCVICSEKLTVGEENEGCVATVCAHYFHKVCLDTWVNEAAQQASNECPLCRQELCKGRARRPA